MLEKSVIVFLLNCVIFMSLQAQSGLGDGMIKLTGIAKSSKYGYSKKKAVKVGSIEMQRHYLNALRGPNGEEIFWERTGTCCSFKAKNTAFGRGLLDIYTLRYEGSEPITLYLNGYEEGPLYCPKGLTFVESLD